MSETVNCPKCGFAVSGAGFGMATCSQCGEIFLLGSESESPGINLENVDLAAAVPPPHPTLPSSTSEPNIDLHELADFGNQEQPSTSTGGLVFDLKIEGINTADNRESLVDILSDHRFGITASEIISKINKGSVTIPRLNPVKASALVGRLKHLPFQVSWLASQLIKGTNGFIIFVLASALFAWVILIGRAGHSESWGRHEVNLKGYQIQITNGEEEMRALIAKKKINTDLKIRDEILKEIIQKNEDLKKTFREMKTEEEHIRFQHPEKGDETVRKYRHLRLKSIEELENEVGLDGQLSRLKNKVKNKYDN